MRLAIRLGRDTLVDDMAKSTLSSPLDDDLPEKKASTTSGLRQRATAERRFSILDAALRCFAEGGVEEISIDALRRSSGASTGSIYHHFGNKDGVVAALYQAILDDYKVGLVESLKSVDEARGFVRGIVLYHVHWAAGNPLRARYLHEVRRSSALASIKKDLRRSTAELLRQLGLEINRYVDAGQIARLPRQLYPPLIIGPSHEVIRHTLSGRGRLDLGSVAEQLADAAWKSLRADEEPPGGGVARRS